MLLPFASHPQTPYASRPSNSLERGDFVGGHKGRLRIAPVHRALRACVVVPVRNEEAHLATLIAALAAQHDDRGCPVDADTFEVLLLLNNCTDRSAVVARELQRHHPHLRLHIAEITFAAYEAHVGKARQLLFNIAWGRFQHLGREAGLILTTDADSRPAPDWIAQNAAEIERGTDAVGGRILLEPAELAALPAGVRKLFLLDIGYRRALEEMRSLYAPQRHDPFPRHHQNFGGSLAVTAAAYDRAGGMPLRPFREDVGLCQAIIDAGGRVRHSEAVRVYTSARMIGRAAGGLADAIGWWNEQVQEEAPVLVESAAAAEARFRALGRWSFEHPDAIPPADLTTTPDEVPHAEAADVRRTLGILRERIEFLRRLPLSARLSQAPPRAQLRHHSRPCLAA